jgi:hypothetical protein
MGGGMALRMKEMLREFGLRGGEKEKEKEG